MEINHGVSQDHSPVLDPFPGDGVSSICCHAWRVHTELVNGLADTLEKCWLFCAVCLFLLINLSVKPNWRIWWRKRYFFRILPDNVSGQTFANFRDTVLSIFCSWQRTLWKSSAFLILGFLRRHPDTILSVSVRGESSGVLFLPSSVASDLSTILAFFLHYVCFLIWLHSFIISLIFFYKALISLECLFLLFLLSFSLARSRLLIVGF